MLRSIRIFSLYKSWGKLGKYHRRRINSYGVRQLKFWCLMQLLMFNVPLWGTELRIELGPALQLAHALPSELSRTPKDLRRTLWATPHSECRATLHPKLYDVTVYSPPRFSLYDFFICLWPVPNIRRKIIPFFLSALHNIKFTTPLFLLHWYACSCKNNFQS